MLVALSRAGWGSRVAPAQATQSGSAAGGTMVVCKSYWQLCSAVGEAGRVVEMSAGSRWVLEHLRLHRVTVILGPVYLVTGIGPAGESLHALCRLGEQLVAAGLPFLLGGGWNMSPEQLRSPGWLKRLGG